MKQQAIDYKKLFDSSPLSRLVVTQEQKEHFYVIKANKQALNYFQFTGDENNTNHILLSDFLDTANATHILQALTVCFTSKTPIAIQVVPKLPSKMQIQAFMLNPVLDEDGNVLLVDMQARPPSNNQEVVERERDDAISMFTTVFDVSDVGITVTDHHGRFVRLNDTFMRQTGWKEIDLLGQSLIMIVPEDDHELAWQRHKLALKEKHRNFGEIEILRKDQSRMNVMITSSMLKLSNGRSFRITTIVDVSELKQIEKDLRKAKDEADEANKAKSAFLANMSHELRTPLNAIIGFSEMMINGTLGPVENDHYVEYLDDIRFSAQHLLQIINDVLDMSKIEAGKMPLDEEEINICGLLDSVRRLMSARAKEHNVDISISCNGKVSKLIADERLVRQVVLNLLSNAVKFSKDNGVVTMSVKETDLGQIAIMIKDQGIGISKDRLDEVMEPFGQVGDPSVNKGQGTGLGLPIAKAMMDMHSGDLVISSTKDEGTCVTCLFPANRVKKKES